MIIDSRMVRPGMVIEAEICIVGAGPAGQTVARELASGGRRIVALDAGPVDANPLAPIAPSRRFPGRVLQTRREGIGGTSAAWGAQVERHPGRYARFIAPSDLDLEARPSLGLPGWPVSMNELRPFYDRALEMFRLFPLDKSPYAELPDELPAIPDELRLSFGQYVDKSEFGERARPLYETPQLDLYLNAAALDFTRVGGDISIRVRSGEVKGDFTIRTTYLVLAAGGVENARLLAAATANQHDQVGRYFMEHPFVKVGVLAVHDAGWLERSKVFDLRLVNGAPAIGILGLNDDIRRREGLLGLGAFLVPRPRSYATRAARSLLVVRQAYRDRQALQEPLRHFASIVFAPHHVARFVADYRARQMRFQEGYGGWSVSNESPGVFQLVALVEQTPQPATRLVFESATDSFGRRLARLEWRWNQHDVDSLDRTRLLMTEILADHRLGRLEQFEPFPGVAPAWDPGHHHLGTTRMAASENEGVVNADCRVFGLDNVFIAGSSVFPTGAGFANPTLTIVALAIRLADHLKSLK